MLKRTKVVMLPTNQKAEIGDFIIFKMEHNDDLQCGIKKQESYLVFETRQHLYILSNDMQEVGDYGILEGAQTISVQTPECGNAEGFQKIIASTDESLGLPQPSKAFVKKYVKLYNEGERIEEVNVEYYEQDEGWCDSFGAYPIEEKIKVDSNNTITIRKVKGSWSKEAVQRVIDLLQTRAQIYQNGKMTTIVGSNEHATYEGKSDAMFEAISIVSRLFK